MNEDVAYVQMLGEIYFQVLRSTRRDEAYYGMDGFVSAWRSGRGDTDVGEIADTRSYGTFLFKYEG